MMGHLKFVIINFTRIVAFIYHSGHTFSFLLYHNLGIWVLQIIVITFMAGCISFTVTEPKGEVTVNQIL